MRVARSNDGTDGQCTPDAADEALRGLDSAQPAPATPAADEVMDTEEIFEADSALAQRQAMETPAPEGAATMIRDAFGNRRRATEPQAIGPSQNTKLLVEMHSLPQDLARQVLSGKLSVKTALSLRRQRSTPTRKPRSSLPALRTLAIAVAGGLLILGSLYLLLALTN